MAPTLRRKRVFVITDETVADLHLATLERALKDAGIAYQAFVLPPGEKTKSWERFQRLVDSLLEHRIERRDAIVALGGGVIGDLAGFAAASVLRGVDYVQIPTTLLAQVDSSVGGKTGINSPHGKNLVGAFHQPRLVLADTGVLDTLPKRELLAGYAEVAKYGLIDRPGFFHWLEANGADVLDGVAASRRRAVLESCAAKADIVARDETEQSGARALLNLGHTFAHALEAECGYEGQLLHGEAVAIGLCMAADLSAELGYMEVGEAVAGAQPSGRGRPADRPGPPARARLGRGPPARPHEPRQEGAGRPGDFRFNEGHWRCLPRPRGAAAGGRGAADPGAGGVSLPRPRTGAAAIARGALVPVFQDKR